MSFQNERELEGLWASYRESISDAEPSPEFMPKLWQSIEARQRNRITIWTKWTGAFVSVSLALCLVFTIASAVEDRLTPAHASSYIDALSEDTPSDTLAYAHFQPTADEESHK